MNALYLTRARLLLRIEEHIGHIADCSHTGPTRYRLQIHSLGKYARLSVALFLLGAPWDAVENYLLDKARADVKLLLAVDFGMARFLLAWTTLS